MSMKPAMVPGFRGVRVYLKRFGHRNAVLQYGKGAGTVSPRGTLAFARLMTHTCAARKLLPHLLPIASAGRRRPAFLPICRFRIATSHMINPPIRVVVVGDIRM